MTGPPKKYLGQNFLVDDNIVRKIIHTFSPHQDDLVVEVGPGKGVLTCYLNDLGVETVAIELDSDLVTELRKRFDKSDVIEIRNQDILEFDFNEIQRSTNKIVRVLGNIPYQITSPLLFYLINHRSSLRDTLIMVQRELAERITAQSHSKSYGILSVMLQTYANTTMEFGVSRNVFRPRPNVDSAVVSLDWHRKWEDQIPDQDLYRILVRTAFGKRRKTLRNALEYMPIPEFDPDVLSLDMGRRAEELDIPEFITLARRIADEYPDFRSELEKSEL